jgi:hypothetical protein
MTPITEPQTKRVFSSERIGIYDIGGAAFLHARGHAIEYVSIDRNGKANFYFNAPDVRRDVELFFQAKEFLLATMDRARASKSRAERKRAREAASEPTL